MGHGVGVGHDVRREHHGGQPWGEDLGGLHGPPIGAPERLGTLDPFSKHPVEATAAHPVIPLGVETGDNEGSRVASLNSGQAAGSQLE